MSTNGKGSFEILPIAGRIGAEIGGVRLSGELEPAMVESIRQALFKYESDFSSAGKRISTRRVMRPSAACSVTSCRILPFLPSKARRPCWTSTARTAIARPRGTPT